LERKKKDCQPFPYAKKVKRRGEKNGGLPEGPMLPFARGKKRETT